MTVSLSLVEAIGTGATLVLIGFILGVWFEVDYRRWRS